MTNIKKYLVYFTICLISLFIFNNNVKADITTDIFIDYNSQEFNTLFDNTFISKLSDLKTYIDNENTYNRHYFISADNNNVYVSLDMPNTYNQNLYCENGGYYIYGINPYKRTSSLYSIQTNIKLSYCQVNGQDRVSGSKLFTISNNDFLNDNYNTIKSNIKNLLNVGKIQNSQTTGLYIQKNTSAYTNEWPSNFYLFTTLLNSNQASTNTFSFIYYSTREIKFTDKTSDGNNKTIENTCSLNSSNHWNDVIFRYNDTTLTRTLNCGDTFPTYLDFIESTSTPITITENVYETENAFDNTNSYNSKALLNIVIDSQYTEYNTICKFTDIFNNVTNFNVVNEYNYTTWNNGTLNCEIKNGNEIIEEYEYVLNTISSLNLIDSYSTTLNNNNTLYSINVSYNFGSTNLLPQYIPFKIEYLSQENTNLTTFVNGAKFYYTNGNSQRYETNLITLKDYKCRKTNPNYIVCNGYIDNTQQQFHNFDVNFILNTFNEETHIAYYDNLPTNWQNRNIDFLITDFTGYIRYNLDPNRNRVYIYKSQTSASDNGFIYFPYTLNHSNTIDMISFYYVENGGFDSHIPAQIYNDYYESYTIDFDNTSGVLIITFDSNNFDLIEQDAYIYVPNYWLVQMQGTTQLGVALTDNNGNKIIISNDYNNTLVNKAYNINTLFGGVKGYLESIKQYTNIFTDEIVYFWNKLNNEQQTFLVSMFMLVVITSIIYLARRH